jgi:hypothetical protein
MTTVPHFTNMVMLAEQVAITPSHPAARAAVELFDKLTVDEQREQQPVIRRLSCKLMTSGRCICGQHESGVDQP